MQDGQAPTIKLGGYEQIAQVYWANGNSHLVNTLISMKVILAVTSITLAILAWHNMDLGVDHRILIGTLIILDFGFDALATGIQAKTKYAPQGMKTTQLAFLVCCAPMIIAELGLGVLTLTGTLPIGVGIWTVTIFGTITVISGIVRLIHFNCHERAGG